MAWILYFLGVIFVFDMIGQYGRKDTWISNLILAFSWPISAVFSGIALIMESRYGEDK